MTWHDPSRCSPANGPTCRWKNWPASAANSASTAWSWPAGATTSRSTRPWPSPTIAAGNANCSSSTACRSSPSATTWSARRCWTTSTPGTRRSCRRHVWGDGDPAGVNARAAEEMKDAARAAQKLGVGVVNGFTGSSIWHLLYSFPPVPPALIDEGFKLLAERFNPILDVFGECGVKFALEVHPTEIAFDLLHGPAGAGGAGLPRGVRLQFRSQPLDLAGRRPGRVHPQVPRPDLPRPHEGRDRHARRPRAASLPAT